MEWDSASGLELQVSEKNRAWRMTKGLTSSIEPLSIKISKEVQGTLVEIWLSNEDDLRDALQKLERVCSQIPKERIRFSVETLWSNTDEGAVVTESVSNPVCRIALSLLRSWPEYLGVSQVADETGISTGHVGNILAGRRGGSGDWFINRGSEWSLSDVGWSKLERLSPSGANTEDDDSQESEAKDE